MTKIVFVLFISLYSISLQAQEFLFGTIGRDEIAMEYYPKDTTAIAVVLNEFGRSRINDRGEGPRLTFEYHVRIKVFNSQKFTRGNVIIPLYKEDSRIFETISRIEGTVFHYDDKGRLLKSDLEQKSIFKENSSNYVDLIKFALPNLSDGCIIEYKYEIESPFFFNFRSWEFQWEIPKIKSEYEAIIPGVYSYNISLVGPFELSKNETELLRECFQRGGYKADCSKITYGMNDIPAFIEEDYMTASKNFLSAINFELSEVALLRGGKQKITKEWKDIDLTLKTHFNFGKQLKHDALFTNRLSPVLANTNTDLEKAKAVYNYIKRWFKWNLYYGKFSDAGIKKALENRSGNVADINLSLVAALSAAGLDAEAVVLSTRENGLVNKLYPVLNDFNYVIAKVNIENESYCLDATDPLMPFGLLPFRCINDQGRVMSLNKASYWIDMVASQSRTKSYTLDLDLRKDGKAIGVVQSSSLGYDAYNKRNAIKKFNTIDEYVDDLDQRMRGISIKNHQIENLDSIENPLIERYEVEIEAFSNLNTDQFFFNPFFMDRMEENPFKLEERTYPVDLGAPLNSRIIITMKFPEEYEIISKPNDKALALPNNGGRFISNIKIVGNTFQYIGNISLGKSIFHPEEYSYLKELYNQIVLLQKTDVVFKKKL